jgi:beta-lactamase class A
LLSTVLHGANVAALKSQIEQTLPRARGEVGVAIKHIESGTEILVNADKKYPMASAYKLPVLVELFYQKSAGKLALEDLIEVKPSDIHIGSGVMVALYEPPGVQLDIKNLINMMMRVSDNSASDILINRVGMENTTERMKTLGLDSIRIDRTTLEMILDQSGLDYARYGSLPARQVRQMLDNIDATTAARANDLFNRTDKDTAKPSDLNRLLEKLVLGEIVDRGSSDQIIAILKECQTGFARIPGLLPPDAVVAHKTGTLGGSTNDTGIVFLPFNAGHMAVTVLMRDARAPLAERERVIAEVTRYAYDYFVQNYSK